MKIKIKVEASIINMPYNIIQVYVSYDFAAYLSEEMKRNLTNLNNGDFFHSSYMRYLIIDQHIQYFISKGLKLVPLIFVNILTPIDMRVSSLTKKHGNSYSFLKHFSYPAMRSFIRKFLSRLNKEIRDEL